jgi:hypothetical protein
MITDELMEEIEWDNDVNFTCVVPLPNSRLVRLKHKKDKVDNIIIDRTKWAELQTSDEFKMKLRSLL